MYVVPKVRGRSRKQLDQLGERFLAYYFPELLINPGELPVLDFFSKNLLEERYGYFCAVEDCEPGIEGYVCPIEKVCVIDTQVYEGIKAGNPRDRFTGAHEIGHVVTHGNELSQRLSDSKDQLLYRKGTLNWYEDPEWQANNFAAAILMPHRHIKPIYLQKAEDSDYLFDWREFTIQELFNVSAKAAGFRIKNFKI